MTDEPKPSAETPKPAPLSPAPSPAPNEPVAYLERTEKPTVAPPRITIDRA